MHPSSRTKDGQRAADEDDALLVEEQGSHRALVRGGGDGARQPARAGWGVLSSLRDEAAPLPARPPPAETSERAEGEGPGPAAREGLAEKKIRKSKVHLRTSVRRVEEGWERRRAEDGWRRDHRAQGRLGVAHELFSKEPYPVELPQAASEQRQQRLVPRLPPEHGRG
jgi:hypothetical protein